jgi:hypothetical protein
MRHASRYSFGVMPTVRNETIEENGVRQRSFPRKLDRGPRARWRAVHLAERHRYSRICQPAQQSRRRAFARRRAQRFDQQDLDEARERQLAAAAMLPASSLISCTSTESRSLPRTCTSAGSSDTSSAASGDGAVNQPG